MRQMLMYQFIKPRNQTHILTNLPRRVSPEQATNLPLLRSEPIWRQVAEERNPGNIKFSHKVIDFTQNGDSVDVHVERLDGDIEVYRTQYMIAAEGGKGFIRPRLGIEMQGLTNLEDIVTVHFAADLSEYWDDRTIISTFINPEGVSILGSGLLIQAGPTWGRYSEEWIFHFGFSVDDPSRLSEDDPATLVPHIRTLLKIPELEIEIIQVSHWTAERVLASKYHDGRVFLAGDAAHRSE